MAKKNKKSFFKGQVSKDAQRQKNAGSSYGYLNLPRNVSVFSPEPGSRVKLDFLPYIVTDANHPDRDSDAERAIPGAQWYKRPFKVHRNIGVTKDAVVCLTSIGKRCPICEYRAQRIKEGADKKETDALKASQRNLYVVIPLGHKKFEEKIHIFDISQAMFQKLLIQEIEENEELEMFPDLEDGMSLKIRFASKSIEGGTPFAEAERIDPVAREKAYDESILEDVPNLDEVLKILSNEELKAKFFEDEEPVLDEEDEDEDEEDEPKKPAVHRHAKPQDEDEDEEDEPKKPVRRREPEPVPEKPMRRKPPVPEPEEDEEDEDEEPALAPAKKPAPAPQRTRESGGKNRCPHGHMFGVDTEDFDDCDTCSMWDACIEVKEKSKKK